MKKLILFLVFAFIVIAGYSQAFFKPVTKDVFVFDKDMKAINPSVWLFRPAVSITAVQFTYDKATKVWNSNAFSSAGLGVGYQHYIDVNGEPYNNFGFNVLMLFNYLPEQTAETGFSFAGTVSALKFIEAGAGYNVQLKSFFILTGIKYNF